MKRLATIAFLVLSATVSAETPPGLSAPGDTPLLTLAAKGVQVYTCKAAGSGAPEWIFDAPRADLFDHDKKVGRHYAGPTWELEDGSRIKGKVVAKQAGIQAGDIPWLRLAVISREGSGALSAVTAIQRIDTRGGDLTGPCEKAGAISEVPYTATYMMLRAAE